MKSYLIAVLCLTLLAACGGQPASGDAAGGSSEAHFAGMNAAGTCSPLPPKVELNFAHQLRSDYYFLNTRKHIRHRVILQYSGNNAERTGLLVKEAMLKAGFDLQDSKPLKKSGLRLQFAQKGYGTAIADIYPHKLAPGDTVGKGSIWFDLPPAQFNPPAKAKKPSTSQKPASSAG